jgi:hypothetical protein
MVSHKLSLRSLDMDDGDRDGSLPGRWGIHWAMWAMAVKPILGR